MKSTKRTALRWYYIALGTILALSPTLMALAGGGGSTSD
jgi:hypothetical protein